MFAVRGFLPTEEASSRRAPSRRVRALGLDLVDDAKKRLYVRSWSEAHSH